MALIHQELYRDNIEKVSTSKYLGNLIAFLKNTYDIKQSRIEVVQLIDEKLLEMDTAIPLGLLFTEIISNIYKYAFPGERKGKIFVELKVIAQSDFQLTISDDGIGFPPDYDYKNSLSLGIQLIYSLVDQLDGTVQINNHTGTTFIIKFKEVAK